MMRDSLSPAPGFGRGQATPLPPEERRFLFGSAIRKANASQVASHVDPKNELDAALNHLPCRTYVGASKCAMEWDMWLMVLALVKPEMAVLEFGARYGTTSCFIAAATDNSGRVVVVEPDPHAHDHLLRNRESHMCNVHVVRGTVGEHQMQHSGTGRLSKTYAFSTELAPSSSKPQQQQQQQAAGGSSRTIPNVRYRELERQLGFRFDAAVLDCEGCFQHVLFEGRPPLIDQLRLVILEQDRSAMVGKVVNYRSYFRRMAALNFSRVWWAGDTMSARARWSRELTYSAWVRTPGQPPTVTAAAIDAASKRSSYHVFGLPFACFDWATAHRLTPGELRCLWAHSLPKKYQAFKQRW